MLQKNIARDVIDGRWCNGEIRERRLRKVAHYYEFKI